ncbi:mechanosensitive ion channel family protein [Streptomonospora nanhaiensis]|uniref:Small-conductance mechanosensitive channel n=1 Tax=Streptomonospora nanhaiensis TaxID=1323731 RepID=A0A853BUW7_9ACTN|nr:mechanosensitive ion channel domain-containing protein [Streptomonospora nanhaiensis]MBV2365679.1 mechanosensitive ion channel family protein [Streptomonospora nanhaiensis]MBX9388135.1 mechanosensitive ion channel family protein [Streptomonospora nanhaiensis]NYI98883.1 small-conductance mechanosensitive channel [Streptomonospora nanhaiensis]
MDVAQWIGLGVAVLVSVLVVTVAHWLLTHQLSKVSPLAGPLVRHCRYSAYAAAAVIGVNVALPTRREMEDRSLFPVIDHAMTILLIATLTWFALGIAYAITDTVLDRLAVKNADDDHRSRRLQTQVRLLRRVAATVIGILAVAAILFTFPAVQGLGAGLLASAGLLSVVAGIAAQSTLGNVFAGLQLAFSDALRLNDIVVFQGEWGRVEELSLTTVTLRMWDERRLVVPVSHFTTNPFENWTKQGASITGWVMLQVDWAVPIDKIREEVGEYVSHHPLWDGRRWSLQATDILEGGLVQLRAVVTTADSDARWDLCCDLREHLITYINENFPEALPRRRTEFIMPGDEELPFAAVYTESAYRSRTGRDGHRAGSPGPDGALAVKGSSGSETDTRPAEDGSDGE